MDTIAPGIDPHSFSQPEQAVVKHLDWKASINFKDRIINATAAWKVALAPEAKQVVFDNNRLRIQNVTIDGKAATWNVGPYDDNLGAPLVVKLPSGIGEEAQISIQYATPSSAKALFWANPAQTHDKKHPFLFTQSQAILARTWIPCQDSPGIRFTYDAEVTVPKEYLALMSAENPQEKNATGTYIFTMEQAIPAYLMALAVGDIAFEPVGDRVGVYAEPGQLEAAVQEFSEMEDMMVSAEELYGPYVWERYDVLVLPTSFPFGGMENPRLTFATPTIIAGDKSLVSLIAHELAHSWSGNLVTNRTWNDFWLNEGFTVYFELRIMEAVAGKDYAEMLASLGYSDLKDEVATLGSESPDTQLKLDLQGRDPDDGMTSIAYEKGYHLLRLIENEWGRANWDRFLKNYFSTYQFKVMDTESFLKTLKDSMGADLYQELKVEQWVYGPGIPENIQPAVSSRFVRVDSARGSWLESGELPNNAKAWTTHEWLRFINNIPDTIPPQRLAQLDKTHNFTHSGNAEIRCAWLEKGIRADYRKIDNSLKDFLTRVGRRKFLTPLYGALVEQGRKDFAVSIYTEARPGYHAVSVQTIDKLLQFKPV